MPTAPEENKTPGLTTLMFAAESDNADLVRLLIEHGADVNALATQRRDGTDIRLYGRYMGQHPLFVGSWRLVDKLRRYLLYAAQAGRLDIVVLLLKEGIPADRRSNVLGDALRNAVSGGYFDLARLLIQNGATVDRSWNAGTFLEKNSAAKLDKIKFLLENGADVNTRQRW